MDKSIIYSMTDLSEIVWSIRQMMEQLTPQLSVHHEYDENTIENYLKTMEEISIIAPKYDYNNIPCNGLRSVLRMNNHFMLRSMDYLTAKEISGFLLFIRTISSILERFVRVDQARKLSALADEEMKLHSEMFAIADESLGEVLKLLFSRRYWCLNYPKFKTSLNFISRAFAQRLHSSFIIGSKYWIMPFSIVGPQYAELSLKSDPERVKKVIRAVDEKAVSLSLAALTTARNLLKQSISRKGHKIMIKSYYEYTIDPKKNETCLARRNYERDTQAKFSILRFGNTEKDQFANKVFLYIHGGGFVGPKSRSYENMFLKDFARKLPGCTFINLDYPLAPENKFPSQIQCVLDFYLWLTSDDQRVEGIIGFKPKEIVIGGESAGANICASLIISLNDIELLGGKKVISMPKAAVLLFGMFEVTKRMYPSLILASADPIVSYPLMKNMLTVGRFRVYQDDNSFNNNVENNSSEPNKRWKLTEINVEDYEIFTNPKIELEPTPYFSPLLYKHFDSESFTSLPLYLLALDFCPLLDCSVNLAKKWPGPIEFIHLDDVCHGAFFTNPLLPSRCSTVIDSSVQLIQSALLSKIDEK